MFSWNYRVVRYRDGRGYAAGQLWAMTEPMKGPVPIAPPRQAQLRMGRPDARSAAARAESP